MGYGAGQINKSQQPMGQRLGGMPAQGMGQNLVQPPVGAPAPTPYNTTPDLSQQIGQVLQAQPIGQQLQLLLGQPIAQQGGMPPSDTNFSRGLPQKPGLTPQGGFGQPQIIPGTGGPGAVNPNLTPLVQQASPFQGPNTSALKSQMDDFMASSPIFQQMDQLRNQIMQSGGMPTPQQAQQMQALSVQLNNDPQMIQFANQMQSLQAPNLQGVGMGSMPGQPMTPQRLQQIMRPQRQRPDFFNAPFSMQGLGSLMRRSRGRR